MILEIVYKYIDEFKTLNCIFFENIAIKLNEHVLSKNQLELFDKDTKKSNFLCLLFFYVIEGNKKCSERAVLHFETKVM